MHRKTLVCVSVDESLVPYILFSLQLILYPIGTTHVHFTSFEEYLRKLERAETDGRTDKPIA